MADKIVLITGGGGHWQGHRDWPRHDGRPSRYHRSPPRPRRTGRGRHPHGVEQPAVDAFVADLSSQTEVRRLAQEVLGRHPRLEVLVSNMGGFWAHLCWSPPVAGQRGAGWPGAG
jgi:NAD(P)-dependent dehydrogenase (short-subunit alcohol dehydrogenase family)